jgi:CarD family transcriptional regulator
VAFKVGDKVVYPSQGAGVVAEKTTREIMGDEHEYLKISFIRGDMEVLVPLKKGEEVGLRHTVGDAEVAKLLEVIHKDDLSLPSQWPPRYRAEQEILASGDAYRLARLIGTLSQRDLDRGLAATEREVLESAKGALASELAVVQQTSLEEAQAQIEETVAAS